MRITTQLNNKDYWEFARRMQHGRLRDYQAAPEFTLKTFVTWVAIAVVFLLFKDWFFPQSPPVWELIGPTFVILLILLAIVVVLFVSGKKRVSPLPDGFVIGPKTFELLEDGIHETAQHYTAKFDWAAVIQVIDDPEHIYLMMDNPAGHIFPKRCFASEDEAQQFLAIVEEYRNAEPS